MERNRSRVKPWVVALIVLGLLTLIGGSGFLLLLMMIVAAPEGGFGDRVGVVRISGPILGGEGGLSLLGEAVGSDRLVKLLEKAGEDAATKAIVLRLNTPGGSAAASQEIHEAVQRLRRKKPVVASMCDVAASGGYYVAAAADKIVADPATLTGSIGVIMETENFEELFKKIGVKMDAVKSGKHKDIGSYSRPMTPEERKILQSLIDDVYSQFVTDVAKGRHLSEKKVRELADGRIYTGRQAKELKLVDELGGFQDAVRLAANLARIQGKPHIHEYGRESLMDALFGTTSRAIRREVRAALRDVLQPRLSTSLLRHPAL